jgi:hypothetical protein
MTEEMISIQIPKSLYHRIDKFATVERAIIENMTEWIEIMEDEERLIEKKFKAYFKFSGIMPYCEIINIREEDKEDDFVGTFSGISNKDSLLRIAREGYGICEDEIEFVED